MRNSKCAGVKKCKKQHHSDDKQRDIEEPENTNGSNRKNNGFISNLKDEEYDNIGSIAGQVLTIRNDQPTVVLLNAILTITTYGIKLCADDNGVKENVYKEIFRSSFINPYKFLLESELAQLYIRHKIRSQEMCKKTGIANISDAANPPKRKCMLQEKCKKYGEDTCPITFKKKDRRASAV